MDLEAVRRLMEEQSTLTLATVSEDGAPRAASLYYVVGEGLEVYWFSSEKSEHSVNLGRGAAVSIFAPTEDWQGIRGVQMRGGVSVVAGDQRDGVTRAYVERFRLGEQFAGAIARSTLYVFRPSWVRYLDNGPGFGYKVEFAPETRY